MVTRFRIPMLLVLAVGALVGCEVWLIPSAFVITRDVPAICPPPLVLREETELPGFGTMVRFTSPFHLIALFQDYPRLNDRNQVALDTSISLGVLEICYTGVVAGDGIQVLERPNVQTRVTDLNDAGLVAGHYELAGRYLKQQNAAVWRDGVFIPLTDPAGKPSEALTVNNRNVVIGIVRDGTSAGVWSVTELVSWESEGEVWTMTGLGVPSAIPSDVNDLGQIVGSLWEPKASDSDPQRKQPFLWQDGELIRLPTLGGAAALLWVGDPYLNNSGLIVGTLFVPREEGANEDEESLRRAVLWTDGEIAELETLGGRQSGANGVNDRGQIVGWAETADDEEHACIWEDGVVRDLNDLLPATLDVTLVVGLDINEEGVILCRTDQGYGVGNLVLLIPSEGK